MRKIRGSIFVSLDGVMQAPGGPSEDPTGGFAHGGWLPQFFDAEVGKAIDAFFTEPYDLLLGRRTYDIFAAYWPYVASEMPDPGALFETFGKDEQEGAAEAAAMGRAFDRATKYVLSRGTPELPWQNSVALSDMDALAEVRRGNGPDLLIQGSSTLYPALIAAGLLDELTVMTFPVLLGAGKRLEGSKEAATALSLTDHKTTSSGAMIATYRPKSAIEHGWAGPQSHSDREKARQAAMAEGRW